MNHDVEKTADAHPQNKDPQRREGTTRTEQDVLRQRKRIGRCRDPCCPVPDKRNTDDFKAQDSGDSASQQCQSVSFGEAFHNPHLPGSVAQGEGAGEDFVQEHRISNSVATLEKFPQVG